MIKKIKVAIIGGSSGEALVNACKKNKCYTILICGKVSDSGYGTADENYLIDLHEKDRITKLIKEKSDCLLMGTGHILAHEIAKVLFDDGFCVSIDPYKAIYGKNKVMAYEQIRKLGYDTPNYIVIDSVDSFNEIDYLSVKLPCVVKSENDAVRTAKANNIKQLKLLIQENLSAGGKAIVEEFITGIEYTIPVISDGHSFIGLTDALDMSNVNKIAVEHLRFFENMDVKYDRKKHINQKLKNEIRVAAVNITEKLGLIGFIRYDLIVRLDGKVVFLEINEVAVSAMGDGHYPWDEVNIDPADLMTKNMINLFMHQVSV